MKSRKSNKAQITLFIIIGIVIVIVFGSLFYVISKTTKIENEEIDTTAIREYITACFEDKTEDALYLVGVQGGYIYDEQYAECEPNLLGIDKICYGIKAPNLMSTLEWEGSLVELGIDSGIVGDIPNPFPLGETYPWKEFPYKNGVETFYGPGIFGYRKLPFLDKIEEQIKENIKKNITECFNFSVFAEQGFIITEKRPGQEINIDLTLANSNTQAVLDYPLRITQGEQISELDKFSAVIPVRLRKIYSFASEIIEADTDYIDFDITQRTEDGIIIKKQETDRYDIIIISDSKSMLKGTNYVLQFLRENRKPALYNGTTNCTDLHYVDPDEDIVSCYETNEIIQITDDGGESDELTIQ